MKLDRCPHCGRRAGYRKFYQAADPTEVSYAGAHRKPGGYTEVWTRGWYLEGILEPHIVVMDGETLWGYRGKRSRARFDVCRSCYEVIS